MKKILYFALTVVVIVIIIMFVYNNSAKAPTVVQNPENNSTTTVASTITATSTTATSTPKNNPKIETITIAIKNFAFSPSPANVAVGAEITWVNQDPMPHQIKSLSFNSPVLPSGAEFKTVIKNAGTYDYSCAIHPSMKGIIIAR